MVQPGPPRPEYLLNNITSFLMHLRSQVLFEKVREAIDLTTGLYRINLSAFNDELWIFCNPREGITVQLGAIWTPVVSVGSLDGLASVES